MDSRPRVQLQGKTVNLDQLASELGGAGLCASVDEVVAAEGAGVTQAQLTQAVGAHVADSEYRRPGPEKDWRTKLQTEIDFLTTQAAGFPANPTAAQTSAAIKRLARDLIRILKFIRDDTLDSGNG